jgi:hypothetical protein
MIKLVAERSSAKAIDRILETPGLAKAVQTLTPSELCALVRRVGLEDAGELVALATTEQLVHLFDDDLWHKPGPALEEQFDPDRFLLWLTALLEAGAPHAARVFIELPDDLATLALHRALIVFGHDELEARVRALGSEMRAKPIERALEDRPSLELDGYIVVGRQYQHWDALTALLAELDQHHRHYLQAQLDACVALTEQDVVQHGGVLRLLTAEETLQDDARAERDTRRSERGFVSVADAESFLSLVATTTLAAMQLTREAADPISTSFFRAWQPEASDARVPASARPATERLLRLLGTTTPTAESTVFRADARPELLTIVAVLDEIAERWPLRHARLLSECAFLGNVLCAAGQYDGKEFRAAEAAQAVHATCNLGLALAPAYGATMSASVVEVGMIWLFRLGFQALYERVARPAAERLRLDLRHDAERATSETTVRRLEQAIRDIDEALAAAKPYRARRFISLVRDQRKRLPSAWLGRCPVPGPTLPECGPFFASLGDLDAVAAALAH